MTTATFPLTSGEEDSLDGGAIATAFAINRTYVDGGSFQWAYELIRNVEQLFDRMIAAGADTSKVGMWFDHIQVPVMNGEGDTVANPLKRRVWNIGTPMHPENELLKFYSRLNIGGGESRWSPCNMNAPYGMGARAAILPWADATFVTSVPGRGSFAITLRGVTDEYGNTAYSKVHPVQFAEDGVVIPSPTPLVKLAEGDDDPETWYLRSHGGTVIALKESLIDPEMREHGGFGIVFLGKGDYTASVYHDETSSKGESSAGIIPAINNRFKGGKFPVRTETLFEPTAGAKGVDREWVMDAGSTLPSGRPMSGNLLRGNNRALKTLTDWTDRAERLDPVTVDGHGTTVTAYLLPEDYWHTGSFTKAERDAEAASDPRAVFEYRSDGTYGKVDKPNRVDSMHPFAGMGQVVVSYNSEMYAAKEPGLRGRAGILGAWGIPQERVARSVLLVVTPPVADSIHSDKWGITQNGARSNVSGPNGDSLPFGSWQAEFLEYFPEKIAQRLAVRPPSSSKAISEADIEKMQMRAFGETKAQPNRKAIDVVDEKGKVDGDAGSGSVTTSAGNGGKPGPGNKPARKTSTPATPRAGGGIKITKRRPKQPAPPQPEFLSEREWSEKGYDPKVFVVVNAEAHGYTIELNSAYPVMERQVKHFWDDVRGGYWSDPRRVKARAKIIAAAGGRTPGADEKAKLAAIEEIEYVYRHDALATFIGAQPGCTNADGSLDTVMFNKRVVTDENGAQMTMSIALSGIHPQEEAIKARLNSLAGRPSL